MKVLHIVPKLNENGGIQSLAKTSFEELKKHKNHSITDWQNIPLVFRVFLLIFPAQLGLFFYSLLFMNYFRKQIKIEGYDLLHFWHTETAYFFMDKKYIVSCHGLEILPDFLKGYKKPLYKKVLDNAALIHADTEYVKKEVIKHFHIPAEKIIVIYPPINVEKFSNRKLISHENLVIGTLCRFIKRKNILNIIKALERLEDEKKVIFTFYLAGNGPMKNEIIEELENSKFKWKYFGEISEKEKINTFYPSLDVFVLPTLNLKNDVEGFGLVYLEANSYGIPVVASNVGGVGEAVGEGKSGVFADPEDPKDITRKIENITHKKNSYLKTAKTWASQFDVKKTANLFEDLYEKAIK